MMLFCNLYRGFSIYLYIHVEMSQGNFFHCHLEPFTIALIIYIVYMLSTPEFQKLMMDRLTSLLTPQVQATVAKEE